MSLRVIFNEPQDEAQDENQSTKNQINPNWLSVDVQARIVTPLIPFSKKKDPQERQINTIKVKMQCSLVWTTLETYILQMKIFENGQPEELIALLKKPK